MPIAPNFIERLAFLRFNKGPAPVLDLFGAAGFRTVTAAIDRGIFSVLADGALAPAAVADRIDADVEGTRTVLGLLAALGYLHERDGAFENTRMTRRWLTDEEDRNVGPWLTMWDEVIFPFWETAFDRTLETGQPETTLYDSLGDDADAWRTVQEGFRATARVLLEPVCDRVPIEGATRLLDLGGGHGAYATELCRRHADLRATVFDHPAALDVAREAAVDSGVDDRVTTRGGDYLVDDLGTGYDCCLLFNVVHGHDAATNRQLFERARNALAPGGRVVVLDQFAGTAPTPVGAVGLAFVDLTYRLTLGTGAPDPETVGAWLTAAGFEDVDRRSIRFAPGTHVVIGTVPS